MPFFLFGVFFLLWLAVTVNARNSLHSSVDTGVRLALTRGQAQLVGARATGLLVTVRSELNGSFNVSNPNLVQLLHRGNTPSPFGGSGWYMREWRRTFGIPGGGAALIPPQYVMALAHAYESMVQHVGPSIRYPCDPRGTLATEGPGCVRCTNLHPMSIGNSNAQGRCEVGRTWAAPTAPGSGTCSGGIDPTFASLGRPATGGGLPYNFDWVGVECEYMPHNALLTPVLGLLQLMSGAPVTLNLVFTYRDFFGTSGTTLDIA